MRTNIVILLLWTVCPCVSCGTVEAKGLHASYLPYVRSHLHQLTTRGLDVYGPRKTDHWMAVIDTRTGAHPTFDHTPKRVYRRIGAPRGCSFYWDQPMIAAAHRFAEMTGDAPFRLAAERYVRTFLTTGIDEHGLFRWGNHRYYDAFEDRFVHFSGGYHEIRPAAPAWDILWQEDAQAVSRQIRVMAARHLHTPANGGFNRHDNGKREHAFLEAGAVLVESLAWLYRQTGERELLDQALRMARYSFKHRGETTGLLVNNPDSDRWDSRVCTTEVGLWARACLRAAEYSGQDEFVDMARASVSAYLRYGYDAGTGRYYGQLRVTDGKPVTPAAIGYWPREYANVWNPDQWPTHDYPLELAQACLTLYGKTGDAVFLRAVRRWAEIIHATRTEDRPGAYAGQYGRCIRFLVRAGSELENERYMDCAVELADEAVGRLYHNGWFQGYAGSYLYEAVDGVGLLLLALMDLERWASPGEGAAPHPMTPPHKFDHIIDTQNEKGRDNIE